MAITIQKVNYTYQPNTPFAFQSLFDINLAIKDGSYTAVIGHTGSGKSTLIQHLNGLLKPTSGIVVVNGEEINTKSKNKQLLKVRKNVGLVFQFPESQLFADTVLEDVKFGPINFEIEDSKATSLAEDSLNKVGIPKELWSRSPFELSGGQMRRVAIAGIIAIHPEILILDEPTAGLDPQGRTEMMTLFNELHQSENMTVILVTHQMNDVSNYADHVVVLEKGHVIKQDSPQKVFSDPDWLKQHHLSLPEVTEMAFELQEKGFVFKTMPLTVEQLTDEIISQT
ncbi:energy-coupling factor transporter ATPase [Pediococcus argentinicus]|uniref:energy-coupling factor transporter ATPase n=2 Tax=Pediococcus argentinicus TaxID=480391 RepID=UPI00070ECE21|nr:energy-coupling factor transporter ATPase [Pediococcus argentinicus]NKZ23046.1 energy-coupling factor transporter ATPase [Pediococcus argentinicus]